MHLELWRFNIRCGSTNTYPALSALFLSCEVQSLDQSIKVNNLARISGFGISTLCGLLLLRFSKTLWKLRSSGSVITTLDSRGSSSILSKGLPALLLPLDRCGDSFVHPRLRVVQVVSHTPIDTAPCRRVRFLSFPWRSS